jgi:Subunit ChlI of Mg-chelatase/Uncharacterised protein family UPF0102
MQILERNWRCRLGEIDIVAAELGDAGRWAAAHGACRTSGTRLSTRRLIGAQRQSAIPAKKWPISPLTINLSPATLPKAGNQYDLALPIAVLR